MAEITVCKGDFVVDAELRPDTHIHITDKIPETLFNPQAFTNDEWEAFLDDQGKRIEVALYNSLPGGTYDRLLGWMLARKASHFRVAHGVTEAAP